MGHLLYRDSQCHLWRQWSNTEKNIDQSISRQVFFSDTEYNILYIYGDLQALLT